MNILAINPWIVDFAAYDFWLKPYGFLVILSYLKEKGIDITYIDCLDKKIHEGTFGRGKLYSQPVTKPSLLGKIPRYLKRYGITEEELLVKLPEENPDYILITSSMTYWYPGIVSLLKILRKRFTSPVILGGTYATLCYEHAHQTIDCDYIFGNQSLHEFFSLLNVDFDYHALYTSIPSYEDFYQHTDYVVLRTSWGCPFNCSYCAIKALFSGFIRVPFTRVMEWLTHYAQQGIRDIVLYDDAFLYDTLYAKKLMGAIVKEKLNLRFHTPNALHLRFLDEEIASLLHACGFINPHFGLETLDTTLQKNWGDKVNRGDLLRGISFLKKGGFDNGSFSVYLLLGYPGQNLETLKEEAEYLHSLGAKVSLAEFSPVPHTVLFKTAHDILTEPLLHNNSIFTFYTMGEEENKVRLDSFWRVKNYVRTLNKGLNPGLKNQEGNLSSSRNEGIAFDIKP